MCSQKSSPVALSVIAIIASDSEGQGLMLIPCIIGQLTQIFMGYIYSRILSKHVTDALVLEDGIKQSQGEIQVEVRDEEQARESEVENFDTEVNNDLSSAQKDNGSKDFVIDMIDYRFARV
jgi:hypothetical protein